MMNSTSRWIVPLLVAVTACQGGEVPPRAEDGAPTTLGLRSQHGMVSSANLIASEVGAEVLARGGNAVDAAIATGLALAVVHPTAGNIGGGGFMVIRSPDGAATAIDFREKAPLAAHPEMFTDEDGEYSFEIHHGSYLAVGVPGTVAGFALAHERYGSATPWADLVEPAVGLAGDGFTLSPALARSLANVLPRMEPYPASVGQFSKDGVPYEEGELFRQPDLARTLARIRDQGHDGFYSGETARLLAEEMVRGGGMITEEDLARYQAQERTPIHGTYRGYDLVSMPPPSSGGTAIVQMLNILEGFDLAALGHNSAAYVHHLTEAMRLAYRDRAQHLADTDFVDVPLDRLTSKDYADELRGGIHADQAGHSEPSQLVMAEESTETTHYSVVDPDGMAVSVTYTLEQGYGSKITVPGAGFLLNNEMGDFNGKPGLTNERGLIGTEANLARPEQRMLSSMSPSVLSRDGELVAVIGTPGGRTIINTVMQLVLNIVDHGMTIEEAVAAPRIHHQWLPNNVRIEEGGISDGDVAALEAMGHEVQVRGSQGRASSIGVDPETGEFIGAPDPRSPDGGAAAPSGG
ncbi:MAG: gamma-glutamyltransferase [Gammaproteobacteria bacterium]|nr:gamma-glutamyltransferase [Gammaproteobacteria bacterium]MDE0650055.1 gamma-glutamyltransferase [Gammaproteobacteria bacterium]